RDVMSVDLHSASPEMPLSKVLDLLRINRISGLPVVEEGKLVGILSIEDIVRAMQKNDLSGALSRLLLVVEKYPDLKSNQNFMHLQDELAGTENRIAVERMRYNETVKVYNEAIRSFPSNILAGMYGFKEAAFFEAPKEAKAAPKVKF
ncbi:MAG: CBS domain-containing protein, partial [Syntrophaceae bacterium]|nr:CBS domain-containing protein [Syntrophaceae bacterium]